MFGVEVTLQDDTKVQGFIFPDRTIYLHEPICDMWHNTSDMLKELDDRVQGFQIIGPVVPTAFVREQAEEAYKRDKALLKRELASLETRYQEAIKQLDAYDQKGGSVSFLSEPEAATVNVTDEVITLRDGTEIKREKLPNGNYFYRSDTMLSAEQHQEINNILAQRQAKEAA